MVEKKKAAPEKVIKAPATKPKSVVKVKNAPLSHGVGRRKKSVARVWVRRGSGKIAVNGLSHLEYFDTTVTRSCAATPFIVLPVGSNYDVSARVCGGGKVGQADAVKLGIARALVKLDEDVKPVLRKHGLLSVDARVKERKKYGQKAARRKFQFVKR